MAFGFGSSDDTEDVTTLIARKQYARAIEVIKERLNAGRPNPRLRLQLGDVLVLAGREREAVMILMPLADEFAREGFAAKAISVLKKIQKIDPGRWDIEQKLASLIETKQKQALTLPIARPASSMPEIGIEEIGFDALGGGPVAVPAERAEEPPSGSGDLGFEAPVTSAPPPSPAPVEDRDLFTGEDVREPPVFASDAALPDLGQAAASPPIGVEARPAQAEPLAELPDLAADDSFDLEALEAEPVLEGEPASTEPPSVDAAFTNELLSVIDGLFDPVTDVGAAVDEPPEAGTQIVVSPLFKDLAVDEMVAVIHGLRLLTYKARKIILRQGDRGDSLYMLTSGRVRAFVKNAQGKQVPLADLDEGAFFGEMSVLTGKPRTATIVAVTPCELLELDRPTLDDIVSRHPRVLEILQEFARQRSRAH